jgi:integrase
MAAKMEKTSVPGIYKRGSRYCVVVKVDGRQVKRAAPNLAAARQLKSQLETKRHEDPAAITAQTERTTFHEYAREWVERYQGTGRRGFREETRDEYRRLLAVYAFKFVPPGRLLRQITPVQIADFIAWLMKQPSRHGGTLSDSSVHNALKPVSACLATARREGLIRENPATDAVLPHRPRIENDEDGVRPFPPGTAELVVSLIGPKHRLMFELLNATGVRRSELIALKGRHLHVTGDRPHIKVRQRARRRRGEGIVIGPLKSKHARREVPIPFALADALRALRVEPDALVFTSATGTILDPDNVFERVLRPACSEAGVEWAGFHTFRHSVASRLFAEGRNVVQVQKWLGHHSPSFTLDTYVHLLDSNDLGGPLESGSPRAAVDPWAQGAALMAAA